MSSSERNQNLTIPNLISVIRIVLIPFFIYFYFDDKLDIAIALLVLSALSDCIDGYIARKFNQITELGKILDPFADKLTQGCIAICLAIDFPTISLFLFCLIAKELLMLIMASSLLAKKKKPGESKWFGKLSTVLFYISTGVIILMANLGASDITFLTTAYILLGITLILMLYSLFKYYDEYKLIVSSDSEQHDFDLKQEIKAKKTVGKT